MLDVRFGVKHEPVVVIPLRVQGPVLVFASWLTNELRSSRNVNSLLMRFSSIGEKGDVVSCVLCAEVSERLDL